MVTIWRSAARWALIIMGICFATAPGSAHADWEDYADPLESEIVDDPAWDKYAFELPFADAEGKLSFKELARSGDPFVLYWWLTDCPLCHLQMPYVQQLQNQIEDAELPLRVVSICVDTDLKSCLPYLEDKGITFETLFDGHARRTNELYKVKEQGTPLAYVFKGGGEFVDSLSGFHNSFGKDVLKLLDIAPDVTGDKAPGTKEAE